MSFSRTQIIILGGAALFLIVIILVFLGIIPGLRQAPGASLSGNLTFWGIEDESVFRSGITDFEKLYPKVRITYEKIDAQNYESVLVDALASGRGPDIFEVHNAWLPKHYNKLSPIGDEALALTTFRDIFPLVAEQDFAPDGVIFALPLYIDTLALYYNQDIFDNDAVVSPPKDWSTFVNLIPKLRRQNSAGQITRAAAALGGSKNSIPNGPDIMYALMLQTGTEMTQKDFSKAIFSSNLGQQAFDFYLRFSNPKNSAFTWNDSLINSRDSFAEGKTVIAIDYLGFGNYIKAKNPFLRFGRSELPQPSGSSQSVNFANYYGLGVSNQSTGVSAAEQFIIYLTTNVNESDVYLKSANHPPALRTLIEKYSNHPDLGIFSRQALTARSWPQIDSTAISNIFSGAVLDVLSGRITSSESLAHAESEVTNLMRRFPKSQ